MSLFDLLFLYSMVRFTILMILLMFSLSLWGQIKYVNKANILGIQHEYPIHMGGGGISFVDFDSDGWDDLTLGTGLEESIHFYRNVGASFQKVALVETDYLVKSVLWVDYNNDGLKDLFVVGFNTHNRLFQNKGNLNLEEVTEAAGLPMLAKRSFGASFADVNRDGWLDLFYAERKMAGESVENQMRLFINNADGSFTDQSLVYGAADIGKTPFCATFFDANNDKWPDVYIANDKMTINTYLENSGNGFFEDKSESSATNFAMNAMSVAIGDFDKNNFTDLYITNTEEGSAFLINTDGMNFSQEASDFGVGFAGGIGWGSNFLDADNDGWEDLYVSGSLSGSTVLSSAFFQNIQGQQFEQTAEGFVGDTVVSYNNAIGDFDNDGYPDIAVINWTPAKAHLWSNISNEQNNWVKVNLEGLYSNKDGIGSKICVYTPDGSSSCKFTTCGIGFLAQNSEQMIFGIGVNQSIDSIGILWPTGHRDLLLNPNINQLINVLEGSTTDGAVHIDDDIDVITALPHPPPSRQSQALEVFPNPTEEYVFLKPSNLSTNFNNKSFEIISNAGIVVLSGKVNTFSFDISKLEKGIYYLKIIDSAQDWLGTFVKQ